MSTVDDVLARVAAVGTSVWADIDFAQPTPSGVLVGRAPSGSEDWHGMRASGLGGSEVAAILGLSPWQSPFSLWHSKANGWIDEDGDDERAWGTALEPALMAWWWTAHPQWKPYGVPGGTYQHRDRAWQHANPDGIARHEDGRLRIVEAKKASSDDAWGEPGTDEVPPYYRVQVVHYMDVLGVDSASFVVTNFGRAPQFYTVDFNPAEAELIREAAADFWASLEAGDPPALDGHSATYQAVRRLHPAIDGSTVLVDPWTAVAWRIARRRQARAEEAARRATSALLTEMGQARIATTPDGAPVARRQPARGGNVALYQVTPKGTR